MAEQNSDSDGPPGTWNYRLIYHNDVPSDRQWIGLHEVHYRGLMPDGDDLITGWTIDPTSFVCDVDEGQNGVLKALEMALKDATIRPMLLMTKLKAQMHQRHRLEDEAEQDDLLARQPEPGIAIEDPEVLAALSDLSETIRADERQKIAAYVRDFSWVLPLLEKAEINKITDDVACALCNQIADAILNMRPDA
jgi:hypothetical protein